MATKKIVTRNLLDSLWNAQVEYNHRIRSQDHPEDAEHWMEKYLLGLVSEVNEVLDEMNWKRHRRNFKVTDKHNLGRELADITKYALCMWELSGFTMDDMLQFCMDKTIELSEQYQQEFKYNPTPGVPILISDVDGTIGDWRKAFRDWVSETHDTIMLEDKSTSFAMETSLGIPFSQYMPLKEEFESCGGYTKLEPYPDAVDLIKRAMLLGIDIILYTSRPAKRYKRIWSDTWTWLESIGLKTCIAELKIGSEERISRACEFQSSGHVVALLEDDPGLALRAANAGILVFLRSHRYNAGIAHKNIMRMEKFNTEILNQFWDR